MCGLVGILEKDPDRHVAADEIWSMVECVRHRGPDDEGIFVEGPIGLGHTRLSIIDLSDAGHQPMLSEDGRLAISYNGEVYNHAELRARLKQGYRFKSRGDTEVVLNHLHRHGTAAVRDFRGMFAAAVWDRERMRLSLIRDRFGIKPLYLYEDGSRFIFASELRAILAHPDVDAELDPRAISDFLSFRYVPCPRTGYNSIRKVEPATVLELSCSGIERRERYYVPNFTPAQNRTSRAESERVVYDELKRSVEYRLIADVPVGIFLSGGLDSSALVAIAAELGHRPLKTFSIAGAGDVRNDERKYARLVADRFDTEHYELEFSPGDLKDVLGRVVSHLGEPLSDMPSIAVLYLSEMAKQHASVVLSGEGGDEIMAGYNFEKYYLSHKYFSAFGDSGDGILKKLLRRWRPNSYLGHSADEYLQRWLPTMGKSFVNGHVRKETLLEQDFWPRDHDSLEILAVQYGQNAHLPFLNRIADVYADTWLTDDLLARADRMSMAHALELRVPFLDHVFVDTVGRLPVSHKVGIWNGRIVNKLILRQIMAHRLPAEILGRDKAGFTLPLHEWACNDLREFFRDTFSQAPYPLRRDGCELLLDQYYGSGGRYGREIWQVLILILWLRMNAEIPSRKRARRPAPDDVVRTVGT